MWIFGYGSLLWYTNFPHIKCVPGVVRNYSRRFWQLSPDHRGTPLKPGRTVTLVSDKNGSCWGFAFKIPDADVPKTLDYLNYREKAGYVLKEMEFHPDDKSDSFPVNVYLASEDNNPYFTGPSDDEEIIQTILSSHGASGSNLEYALKLAECLHKNAPHVIDEHLFSIERKLLNLCEKVYDKNRIPN